MRVALFAFNILALAALIVPALMIFSEIEASRPLSASARDVFIGLLGGGALAGTAAAAGLSRREGPEDFRGWTSLAALGLLLMGAALLLALSGW
jgi:hypothetical protein